MTSSVPLWVLLAVSAAGPAPAATEPRAVTTVSPSRPRAPAPERSGDARALLGRWQMAAAPRRIVELRAGGTGSIDGLPLTWSVEGDRLTITDPGGTDTVGWRVDGDRLVLAGPFDTEIVLVRR